MNTTNTEVGYSTPRDTFLYLLGLVTLVASAVSFGLLVYQFIDIKFPDVLRQGYYGVTAANYELIRSALATLVIVFPVFFWTSRVLHKDVLAEPEKRAIRIRRWLLYFTVFIAALVVIGDLITLIHSFLGGDLTTPFLLKVLTVFFIAGSTLFYYLSELRDRAYPRRVFQAVIILAVLLSVCYGFYTAGSPQNQRLVRFDQQKVNDLQSIQSYLVYNYWQQKGDLPPSLDALNDSISNFMVPKDPQTAQPYEYHVTGPRSFQLCASFNKENTATSTLPQPVGLDSVNDNWNYTAGHVCFDRTIDPALYPVRPKP